SWVQRGNAFLLGKSLQPPAERQSPDLPVSECQRGAEGDGEVEHGTNADSDELQVPHPPGRTRPPVADNGHQQIGDPASSHDDLNYPKACPSQAQARPPDLLPKGGDLVVVGHRVTSPTALHAPAGPKLRASVRDGGARPRTRSRAADPPRRASAGRPR